jgi:thymidine phosphorylase
VPSIPLITASILSKKLAEGIDELVMDVKYGAGAFMKTEADARALADSLKEVGEGAGVHTRVCLTDMNEPLGEAVGNALEVEEAQRCLRGEGPADLEQLVCRLIGDDRALPLLRSGGALGRWERMVRAHGGDSSAPLLGGGCTEEPILAPRGGLLLRCDAYAIAQAAFLLGAGRERADQAIHPGVGLRIWKKGGQRVEAGEALGTLVHAGRGLDEARQLCARAWTWADAD